MKNKTEKKYYTYILLTENNTLYCGYTDDVEKRFITHTSGKGAKYTRANKPIKIIYTACFKTKSEAMKEEAKIKAMKKEEKLEFIKKDQCTNPKGTNTDRKMK